MTSTGTARKNSTNTADGQRISGWVDSRPTPNTKPTASARTIDTDAAVSVPCTPGRMYVFHRLAVRNGSHFAAVSWPFFSSREYTTQSTSRVTMTVTTVTTRLRTRARGPGASNRTDDPLISALGSSRKRSSPRHRQPFAEPSEEQPHRQRQNDEPGHEDGADVDQGGLVLDHLLHQ